MASTVTVPADLQVDIRDPRIAEGITPAAMQEWCRGHGWLMARADERAEIWEQPGAEVLIPVSADFIDYPHRVKEFIACMADFERVSQLVVWCDLRG